MRRILRFIVVFLLGGSSPFFLAERLTQSIRDQWEARQGLPQNSVLAIVQDQSGYLWLGTQEGLVRFDGLTFIRLDKQNTAGLTNNYIYSLVVDDESLWIATRNGLFHKQDGRFTAYDTDRGLPDNRVFACYRDSRGHIWAGTNLGPARYRGRSYEGFETFADGQKIEGVRAFYERDGHLWLGTRAGVYRYDGSGFTKMPESPISINSLAGRDQRVYLGTGQGIFVHRDEQFARLPHPPGTAFITGLSLLLDEKDQLWVGSTRGLYRLKNATSPDSANWERLGTDIVRSLNVDQENSLWFGTLSNGLFRLRQDRFTSYTSSEGLANENAWTITQDREGGIWVGTDDGINRLTRHHDEQLASYLPGIPIRTITATRRNDLWVGTRGNGLFILRDGQQLEEPVQRALANTTVRVIYEDVRGRIWLGSAGKGLWYREPDQTFHQIDAEGQRGSLFIQAFEEDGHGNMWVGADGALFRLEDQRLIPFELAHQLRSRRITAIYADNDGTLWIGSDEELACYRDGQLRSYTIADGLYNDNIFCILEDDRGRLWSSGNRGVFYLRKKDIENYQRGLLEQIPTRHFGNRDGMASSECNFGGSSSGFRDADGRLWFPTVRGVATIDPQENSRQLDPPPLLLESIWVNDRLIPTDSSLKLGPGVSSLEIRYNALSLIESQSILFKKRLEGFRDTWSEPVSERAAYYTNLAPGRYRFSLTACNKNGLWNPTPLTLDFEVMPHFYQRSWFVLLALCLLVLFMIGFYRIKVRTLLRHEQELEDLVSERTRALKDANKELLMTQKRLLKTAHQAGMAEISAQVLHNIGNSLNSLNTSYDMITQGLDEFEFGFLRRIVELLERNRNDLSTFFAEHQTARKLPEALIALSDSFESNREELCREIVEVGEQINHMNRLVLEQHKYAGGERYVLDLDVNEVIREIRALLSLAFDTVTIEEALEPLPRLRCSGPSPQSDFDATHRECL